MNRFMLAVVICALVFSGCDNGGTGTENPPADPEGAFLSWTGCKYGAGKTAADSVSSDTDRMIYAFSNGTLSMTHVNTAFNCCPDSLTATFEISGDTIRIHEEEFLTDGGCRCLCLYDLDYEIRNLDAGTYSIELDQMYLPDGDEPLAFDIDLTAAGAGSYSVTRTDYPWGT